MSLTKEEQKLYDKTFREAVAKVMSKVKPKPLSKKKRKQLNKLYAEVVKHNTGNPN